MLFSTQRRSLIPYDMMMLERSADDARRFARCGTIYHKGQELAWDGREVLASLMETHAGIRLEASKKQALQRILSIIVWGEFAAWKIAAQLADRIEPVEAKMAATSQAHDEARHFYTMWDYVRNLDAVPGRLDGAPDMLLNHVLSSPHIEHKLLGMQLMVEPIALSIFQTLREQRVEPVLADLLAYFERDEARHVGLGMQYMPLLLKQMTPRKFFGLLAFHAKLIGLAMWELRLLAPDLSALGVDTRFVSDRATAKQTLIMREAMGTVSVKSAQDSVVYSLLAALADVMFPRPGAARDLPSRVMSAWEAFRTKQETAEDALTIHSTHAIRTARGIVVPGEQLAAGELY